jgi:polyisoprenoid-binding protein YceI
VQGTLVIDAASFDTKNKKRDDHLRTADFLEADKYPAITFTAK